MTDLNKFFVMGRLTKDPEMSATKNGISVAKFSIACNKDKKQADGTWASEANYINGIKAFGKLAEVIGKISKKGDKVFIEAEVSFTKQDDKYYTNIIVQHFLMLSSKPKDNSQIEKEAEVIMNEAWKAGAVNELYKTKTPQPEPDYVPDENARDAEIPF